VRVPGGLQQRHRRAGLAPPLVRAGQRVRRRRRAGGGPSERPDGRGPGPRARRVAAGTARSHAGRRDDRRVPGHRRDAGHASAPERSAGHHPGRPRAGLPGGVPDPGGHRAVGRDRVPRRAAGRAAPGDARACRDRRGERRVRRLARPPDRRRAAGQRAGRRPRAGGGPRRRRRRGDRRGRCAVLLAAGPVGPAGRARAAAPGHELRRPGGRLDGRPPVRRGPVRRGSAGAA